MTAKSACGAMVTMVIVIVALGMALMYSIGLGAALFLGVPLAAGTIAIAVIVRAGMTGAQAEQNAEQERNDAADALKQSAAELAKAQEEHRKLSADSARATASLEAELDELVALMQSLAAGDLASAKRARLSGARASAAFEAASGLRQINADARSLVSAMLSGDFKRTVNAELYKGEWNKLLGDLNRAMAAAADVITQTKAVCDGFAQGTLGGKVDADARGELQLLKSSVNNAAQNLSKYVSNIADALGRSGARGRSFAEMPGDFAAIKSAISATEGTTAIATPKVSLSAAATAGTAISRTSGAKPVKEGENRFSGAPKVNDMTRNAAIEFNRKDFGKY